MNNEQFYDEVAKVLGTTHEHLPFTHRRRNRWNNRGPGSGRFPGKGIVRVFGDKIHVALTQPMISKICNSKEEALELLASVSLVATNH
jgi:hypothetical protein